MNEPPWLEEPALEVVRLLLGSHQAAFGRPLLAGIHPPVNPRQAAQDVFAADQAVLAHDGSTDPRLIYANAAAIRLWRRPWEEMIGLPSRLTAEPQERLARAEALAMAQQQEALAGYAGIRVDREGRRFRIEGAKVWTLRDPGGSARGQAACFASWWWL
ncbi:MAG: MEKHLA domain-containing protein [Cyanobacteriota bacterium]|nr:MEKHLA domain-containing protein [Cyanobacteriota bacterium]